MSEQDPKHSLADDIAASGLHMSKELKESLWEQDVEEVQGTAQPAARGAAFSSSTQEVRETVTTDTQDTDPGDPTGTAFFKAMNAYRAARKEGDKDRLAEAQKHLQDVVRSELSGDAGCEAVGKK